MTKQEVEQSLPFKAVKKILKKTYPFITKIEAPDDVEKYKSLIFLDIYVDLFKLKEMYPKYNEICKFYRKYYIPDIIEGKNKNLWGSSSFGVFFEGGTQEERFNYFRPVADDIGKILQSVGRSQAIPEELRLHNNRTFDISNFYADVPSLKSGLSSQP